MLLTGIMIKNIPELYIEDWKFDQYWVKSSGILRGTALVVILMRAGLGLDPKALKRLSGKWMSITLCSLQGRIDWIIRKHLSIIFWNFNYTIGF